MAVVLVAPLKTADDAPRTRVEQQLRRVETMALIRRMGPVGAQTINLTLGHARDEAVEDTVVRTVQPIAAGLHLGLLVKEAQFDGLRMLGEHREVHAAIARMRPHGEAAALFWRPGCPAHANSALTSINVPRGGRVSSRLAIWPCAPTPAEARGTPAFPTPDPP